MDELAFLNAGLRLRLADERKKKPKIREQVSRVEEGVPNNVEFNRFECRI